LKKVLFLLAILLVSSFIPPQVLADGMVIKPRSDNWEYMDENSQVAAINYQDGYQKMIISTNFNMQDVDKVVWIFPVPSDPRKVVIDVTSQFPRFYGSDVVERTKNDIDELMSVATLTQIYPIFFAFRTVMYAGVAEKSMLGTPEGAQGGTIEGVVVWENIEKEGITVQTLTTRTTDALYDYFQMKGVKVDENALNVLNYYIGKDYSFIVSWVSNPNQLGGYGGIEDAQYQPEASSYRKISPYMRQPGVAVTFPTDSIYYPLIPTSVYGSKKIPLRIYVIGYVKPELYGTLKSYAKTSYYFQENIETYGLEDFFGNMPTRNVEYTKVEMSVPSKYFLQDLWFEKGAPAKVYYATAVYKGISSNKMLSTILIIAMVSSVAGAVAGFILFGDPIKFAWVGLANLFSIIGLAIALTLTKTKKIDMELKRRLKNEGLVVISSDRRKFFFLVLFSILFIVLCYVFGYLIKLPLM